MHRHQEWIDNRSYEQHLQCLERIKSRKNHSANGRKIAKKHQHSKFTPFQTNQKQNRVSNLYFSKQGNQNATYQMNLLCQTSRQNSAEKLSNDHEYYKLENTDRDRQKVNGQTSRNAFSINQNLLNRSKKQQHLQKVEPKDCPNMSLRQQQLLWNNFLLGKRILQTSPVISKRKHDQQYQKHKELVRSMTSKKPQQNCNFRLRKLHQHNDKIYKISDDHRIENNLHKRYMITLIIQSIEIFKYKFSSFENILVSMKLGHASETCTPLQQKPIKTKQVSQCIPSAILTSYKFFFNMKKKFFEENTPVIIQIKNVKSLNVISIGTFSFQFSQAKNLLMKQAKLFNFGKFIGIVKFDAHYGKKDQFLSHL